MIGHRRNAGGDERFSQFVDPLARAGIDHACLAAPFADQLDDAGLGILALALGGEDEIGPVETVDDFGGIVAMEFAPDVVAGPGAGGRSEERRVGQECVSTFRSRLSSYL